MDRLARWRWIDDR